MIRIVLLIISLIPLTATIKSETPRRIYHVAERLTVADTTIVFHPMDSEPYAAIEIRVSVDEPRRLRTGSSPAWFEIECGDLRFISQRHTSIADNIHDDRTITLSIFSADTLLYSESARDLHLDGGENSYLLEWNDTSDTLNLYAGHNKLRLWSHIPLVAPSGSNPISYRSEGQSHITLLVAEEKEISRDRRLAGLPPATLDSAILDGHHDFPAGVYNYLDRSSDPDVARQGGRYSLAILPDPEAEGRYIIYYLSGAEVESDFWQPGMIKGRLKSTPFRNQYDLEWFDAHGNPLPGGIDSYAVTDRNAATLTLTFPSLSGATLRFARTSVN